MIRYLYHARNMVYRENYKKYTLHDSIQEFEIKISHLQSKAMPFEGQVPITKNNIILHWNKQIRTRIWDLKFHKKMI